MGLESHIQELADKHHKLDEQIHEELLRPHPDDLMISELKKKKLRLKEEIENLESKNSQDPRILKQSLAEEITIRIHGNDSFQRVLRVSELLFGRESNAEFLQSMTTEELNDVSREIPKFELNRESLNIGINIVNLLTELCPVFSSKSEARRAIQNNALNLNKEKITDPETMVQKHQLLKDKFLMIENGKKNKFIIDCI